MPLTDAQRTLFLHPTTPVIVLYYHPDGEERYLLLRKATWEKLQRAQAYAFVEWPLTPEPGPQTPAQARCTWLTFACTLLAPVLQADPTRTIEQFLQEAAPEVLEYLHQRENRDR
jgi:hypothetical protein